MSKPLISYPSKPSHGVLVASHDEDIASRVEIARPVIDNLDAAFKSGATKRLYQEKLRRFSQR